METYRIAIHKIYYCHSFTFKVYSRDVTTIPRGCWGTEVSRGTYRQLINTFLILMS